MLRLLKVTGNSLTPKVQPGDFVIVSKIPFLFSPPKAGDLVAFRQPGYGTLIKLVEQVDPLDGNLQVTSTQPGSVDSRVFGLVRRSNLLGKVIWHVAKPRVVK